MKMILTGISNEMYKEIKREKLRLSNKEKRKVKQKRKVITMGMACNCLVRKLKRC